MTLVSPALTERAAAEAGRAAEAAAVSVRPLAGRDDCATGSALLAAIWGTAPESAPFTSDALTSFDHAGACLLGAFADGGLVGLTVGIGGAPWTDELYSMIAGVAPGRTGRGVGFALKLAQRAWALEHGAKSIVWTFDPLVRRNAHFNLDRLGAWAAEYLPDFYPPMHDALNRADLTDRLVAVWDLDLDLDRPVRRAAPPDAVAVLRCGDQSEPVAAAAGGGAWLVETPPDIEGLRRQDPALARRWRIAIRDVLQSALGAGRRITGFTAAGAVVGAYVLEADA